MKKILVLTTCYPSDEHDPSGIFIARLLEAVQRRGFHITVLAPSVGTFYGRRTVNGIETIRFGYFFPRSLERLTVGLGGIPENIRKSLLAKFQVIPMMAVFVAMALREARRCHVVYANWIGAGVVGAIVRRLTGKPLVVSFRGDDGYLARDRPLWRRFTKFVLGRASIVAPVSSELLDIMRDLGATDSQCCLPRFGIDRDMFRPPDCRTKHDGDVRALFVGALIPKKGLQDVFEAMKDPALARVRLVIVGDGYYADDLRSLCANAGLAGRTEWKGLLSHEEVAEIMRAADLLCLPSYTEGTPNVVKEAMASGLPIVATTVGGIPDLVKHGETGLLFEPGNVGELRLCLAKLVDDAALRLRMGAAGHARISESGLSWDAAAEDFDRIFSAL